MERGQGCWRVGKQEVTTENSDLVPKHHVLQTGLSVGSQLCQVDDTTVDQLCGVDHLCDLSHGSLTTPHQSSNMYISNKRSKFHNINKEI